MSKLCQILLSTLLLCTLTTRPPIVFAAKILGLFAHPSESHFNVMRSMMKELARREHNVTIYSSHRLNERVENLKEMIIEPEYPFWHEVQINAVGTKKGSLVTLSQLPDHTLQKTLGVVGAKAADYFLSHAAMQQLLQLTPSEFDYDLIIVDLFYTEALLALGYLHGIPTIGVVSSNFQNYMQHVLESFVPVACSPNDFETYQRTETGYWQRLSNTRQCIAKRKLFAKSNHLAQEKLITRHFHQFKTRAQLPTIDDLHATLAVLLLNNHVPLSVPRPMLPNTVLAGGLHIRPPRELPWHVRRFVEESRVGVIYMNLGDEQLCAELPQDKLQTLYNTFAQRRERVLWTCHDADKLEGMPEQFMLQHMVSQTDILAHPHIKAFIMSGDLLSLQEGIVRHVPVLGVPLFREQLHNMDLAERLGVGIQLAYTNFTEDALNWALDRLLYESEYALAIRRVSTAFRDRPLGALETSMYWVDYVLRHNGGADIKTRGVGISSSQLHLFDLFIFYFGMATLCVAVLVALYYGALFVWKRRQVEKPSTKMN